MINNIQLTINHEGTQIGFIWVPLVPQKGDVIVVKKVRYIIKTVEWHMSTGAGVYKVQLNVTEECF